MSDRVFGAFIVKQSKRKEPHASIYDFDEIQHVLLVEYTTITQNGINEMRINGIASNSVNNTIQDIVLNKFEIINNTNHLVIFFMIIIYRFRD